MESFLIKKIAEHFNLNEMEIFIMIRSAPFIYKVYDIPKKRAGEYRTIAQPAKKIKLLQYWMIDNILKQLPVHDCAMAYVPKRNIRDNANIHVNNRFLLKMDFERFFPSIKPKNFYYYMKNLENPILADEDIDLAINILFWKPKGLNELELSIGAPSSPLLSNILMFEFDNKVYDMCKKIDVSYSRYSDDLTFSTNRPQILRVVRDNIQTICKQNKVVSLKINERKTIFSSKKHRRRVTGLILTNEGNVSLGREKKRLIRTRIHHFIYGELSKDESLYLKGLLAFAKSVEPTFLDDLKKRYTEETIKLIMETT